MVRDASRGTTRGASEEVSRPAKHKVGCKLNDGEGTFTNVIMEFQVDVTLHGAFDVRHVGLTLSEMICAGMMNSMRALPGEIRNQERGVKDITNGVLNEAVVRECVVPTFVCNDPAPCCDRASYRSICKLFTWRQVSFDQIINKSVLDMCLLICDTVGKTCKCDTVRRSVPIKANRQVEEVCRDKRQHHNLASWQ